jgi:hypothetical protein
MTMIIIDHPQWYRQTRIFHFEKRLAVAEKPDFGYSTNSNYRRACSTILVGVVSHL